MIPNPPPNPCLFHSNSFYSLLTFLATFPIYFLEFLPPVEMRFFSPPQVRKESLRGWKKVNVTESCQTLCDPMDYTVHGILQARILECVAFSFSRGSFQPWDGTQVCRIAGGFFSSWATRETLRGWRWENFLLPAEIWSRNWAQVNRKGR